MQKLSKSGNWWLPGKQEKQFHGQIVFNQIEGGTLTLSDTLDKLYDFPTKKEDFIILGNLTEERNGETKSSTDVSALISLVTNFQEKISPTENSVKVVLRLKYIFLGVHIKDKDTEFQRIVISYSNLNDWISAIHDLKPDRSQERTIYSSPVITVNDECRVQITSSPTFRREDSKTIREDNIQFIIESLNDKSFYHYLELEGRIRDFLNFVITKSVTVKSFEGLIDQGFGLTSFTILFRSYITEKMHKIDVKSPTLFYYSETSKKLQDILNKWFELYIEYKITIDLYFGVIYNIHSFSFNNFLMLFAENTRLVYQNSILYHSELID
jgi:hypothetical protein